MPRNLSDQIKSERKGNGKENSNQADQILPLIDIAAWEGEPPARRSLWGEWLPAAQLTMLTGEGGVGKSLFAQMLCTAIALGKPFLGMATERRNALYVTCEDDADELWRRQDAICEAFGVRRDDLDGKLFLSSLSGLLDTALAVEDCKGGIEATDRWRSLELTCRQFNIGFFTFDNATDALGADHNVIHPVAAFSQMLTGLAIAQSGAAMIVHHPNKSGDAWLGSVAWHNKVRSRLLIKRGDSEMDLDCRKILNPKLNYGPSGGEISFRWFQGAFRRDEDLPKDHAYELAKSVRVSSENGIFMACLRARTKTPGREVGPNIGPNYAPARFAEMTEAKGLSKKALTRAMERLFHIGAVETKEIKRKGNDKKTIIVEAGPNSSERPSEPLPNNHSDPFRTSVKTVPNTHFISKDISGAAHEAAAPSEDIREGGE